MKKKIYRSRTFKLVANKLKKKSLTTPFPFLIESLQRFKKLRVPKRKRDSLLNYLSVFKINVNKGR